MEVPPVARRQAGVLTRQQALESGLTPSEVKWRLGRGHWQHLHRGVYLTSPGAVPWKARAWAALLQAGQGAVLALESAAHVWRLRTDEPTVITVAVPWGRHPAEALGVRTVQRRHLTSQRVDGLPVTRAVTTVLDLADLPGTGEDDVVALAARACQFGRATPTGLLEELNRRPRHRHRASLLLALGEIEDGAESLPEVWFARLVLRRHGLPTFERQVVEGEGTRTDFKNRQYGINVEVDGRIWHAGERFHSDRRRDRASAARGEVTMRVTPLELARHACDVATDVAAVLRSRGWTGSFRPCRVCREAA